LVLAKLVMVAFVEVLDEVGERCAEAGRSFAEPYAPHIEATRLGTAHAVSAYRHVQGERPESLPPKHKTENFTKLISEAVQSTQRLKKLRRQLAWRLHPDRGHERDPRPLPEINAAIDAALARCSSARE
jgi:uncharacterized membrane protein YccC